MKQLTDRQAEILNFIAGYIERNGFGPSTNEIAYRFNILGNAALDHVKALERKEAITRVPNAARTIRLNPDYCEPD